MKAAAPFSTLSRQVSVAFSSARSVTCFQQQKAASKVLQAHAASEVGHASCFAMAATLAHASTRAVAMAWSSMAGDTDLRGKARLVVGGGGARNPFVMELLAEALEGVVVEPMDALGVPADAAEAMAFSLMGRNALRGLANQLPQCTGVPQARVLGVVHGAEWLPAARA